MTKELSHMSAIQKLIDERMARKTARDIHAANEAAAELAAKNAALEAALELLNSNITWWDDDGLRRCEGCDFLDDEGHDPECKVGNARKALAKASS